nr:hypothetical protein [Streptomyces sp. DSM 41633]
GLVILPFFVTFLIRTIAWKTILADDGLVVSALGSIGLLPSEGRLLSTSWAVIGGLTYNWIIFMILPLYVSLEKIDPRLIEASKDLYSTNTRSFTIVILPLWMPGVLAGSMLVFIPAAVDFINADYLGSTQTTMIGNVIQKQFLVVKDYPDGPHLFDRDGVDFATEPAPPTLPYLDADNPGPTDPATKAALEVMLALPPDVVAQVGRIAAPSVASIALTLTDGRV